MNRAFQAVAALALVMPAAGAGSFSDLPIAQANDNRRPAGTLKDDTLRVHLVITKARWYPEADNGLFADVVAFAEKGSTPTIPGPLIRVKRGTVIAATLTNELTDSTAWMHGLQSHPSARDDSVAIKPGETRTLTFNAGASGTYLYYARTDSVAAGVREREQLAGAFIVDSIDTPPDDRVMVINIWGDRVGAANFQNTLTINGKSWPYTERISANLGDTLRWRVINASRRGHPMHLHGFYFRLDSRGTMLADTSLAVDQRRLEVTEFLTPGTTMSIAWSPDRPGNWLFHCHFTPHVNEGARLGFKRPTAHVHQNAHDGNPMEHMAGLVMGISVSDSFNFYRSPGSRNLRKLRVYADERKATEGSPYAMSYVVERGSHVPAVDSIEKPGQRIVLTQNQPVEVTIVNRTHAATSIHWHGLELESFSDGVAGWSGAASTVAPMIAPNDSFVARLIVPRTGTFIYHTHLNDIEQITSGAYGPIIVLAPGEHFDPETDHTFTLGWRGVFNPPKLAINGDSIPSQSVMRYGVTHRLRFIGIGAAGTFVFTLKKGPTVMKWRPVAKDGAALPGSVQVIGPAAQQVSTGETIDVEWSPPSRGRYQMTVTRGGLLFVTQPILVR